MAKWIFAELDGVVFNNMHRKHFADKKMWANYFDACIDDPINQLVVDMLRAFKESGYKIAISTGRSANYRVHSKMQMEKVGLHPELIFMKESGQMRMKHDELKRHHYGLFKLKCKSDEVVAALDPYCANFWLETGCQVFPVKLPVPQPVMTIEVGDEIDD